MAVIVIDATHAIVYLLRFLGTCFVRTDQLDGETDWKLRVAVPLCQRLPSDQVIALDVLFYCFVDVFSC